MEAHNRTKPLAHQPVALSASEMAVAVRERRVSPEELLDAHLHRIDTVEPQINAFASIDRTGARRAARVAGDMVRSGKELGPLHGIPLSIKSSIDVAGWTCPAGSRLRSDYVAQSDAPLVARLRRAGAILVGNTNTPEFLMAYETDNVLQGHTNNPWDLERTAGGSSGGEAAAIAAGCVAAGVGSDGGGSIRIPAHYSGICGLKPTGGRIPATGHFPPSTGPFALLGVVGPMARTIADLELLFEVMAGLDYGDPSSSPVPVRKPNGKDIEHLRIGFFDQHPSTPVNAETKAAVHKAASALRESGLQTEPFLPSGLERARELWWNFFGRAGELVLGPSVAGRESELSSILKDFLHNARSGPPLTRDELMGSMLERDDLRYRLLQQMERYPILLSPVCAVPAFRHGEREWLVDGQTVGYWQAMSYTQWFNLLGNPAVVVPVSVSPEGLPIGVQIIGRPFEDEIVLAVAKIVEAACASSSPLRLGLPPFARAAGRPA